MSTRLFLASQARSTIMPANIYSITSADVETWPTPNYVDPYQRNWLPAYAISWQVISTVLLSGRFYLRARGKTGHFCIDDALILIAWVCSCEVVLPSTRRIG